MVPDVQPCVILKEYQKVLKCDHTLASLAAIARQGDLRASSTRSIFWRIFLNNLPLNALNWEEETTRNREKYDALKKTLVPNPHDVVETTDPQDNNPLSENHESAWYLYFADSDTRDLIWKDVERTYPGMEFFQDSNIRRIMCDILLVFAKEFPHLGYKQGMHEILAPFIFVLYNDQQAFQHALEFFQLRSLSQLELRALSCIFNKEYLEADAYHLFSNAMDELLPWYEGNIHHEEVDPLEPRLFKRLQDIPATSRLLEELNAYSDRLAYIDPILSKHLTSLDIPTQLYGIRWLRLLFGREFTLPDQLFLWDLIWSDRPISRITECIFIAMLENIRQLLLESDYGGCLQFLMRYPPVVDVMVFAQSVLHFRSNAKVAQPQMAQMGTYSQITVHGTAHPNFKAPTLVQFKSKAPSPPVRGTRANNKPNFPDQLSGKELRLFEEQVSILQQRLNERDIATGGALKSLHALIRKIEGDSSPIDKSHLLSCLKQIAVGLEIPAFIIEGSENASAEGVIEIAKEVNSFFSISNSRKAYELADVSGRVSSVPKSQKAQSSRNRIIGFPRF